MLLSPPRPALRELLYVLLPVDSLLNAFCIDYFAEVSREFTNGLTRTDKLNLLLEHASPITVLQCLMECCTDADVPKILQQIVDRLSPAEAQASALREELDQLYLLREQRMPSHEGTADLDARIVQIKRAQRESPQLKEGDLLGDRYWLQRLLGKGGFAKVWQAFDRIERRLVALKVLHRELSEDPRRLERFSRGVAKLRAIHHPHVVAVYSSIEQDAGACFVAMEYLPGGDLHQAIMHHRVSRQEGLCAVLQVCGALSLMHREGMIHRDVKPQNILLNGDGIAKLADFDLVWAADTTGGTQTGSLGTFLYAAPEAMVDGSDSTCRADVYSVAMTLLFVLYGQPLPANIHYTLSRFIDRIDAPAKLKTLLSQATHLDPTRRTATIEALRSALRQASSPFLERLDEPTGQSAASSSQSASIERRTRLLAGKALSIVPAFLANPKKRALSFGALTCMFLLGTIGVMSLPSGPDELIDIALESYHAGAKDFSAAHYDTARKAFESALQLAPDSQELKHYLTACDREDAFRKFVERAKEQLHERNYGNALNLLGKVDNTSIYYDEAQEQARVALGEVIKAIHTEASELAKRDNAAALEKVNQGLEYAQDSVELLELKDTLLDALKTEDPTALADNSTGEPSALRKPEQPETGDFSKPEHKKSKLSEGSEVGVKISRLQTKTGGGKSVAGRASPDAAKDSQADTMLNQARSLIFKDPRQAKLLLRRIMQMYAYRAKNPKVQEAFKLRDSIKSKGDKDDDEF